MKFLCVLMLLLISIHTPTVAQTVIKMHKVGAVYEVPCRVNGLSLKFILDTGASDVSLSLTEARFMLKNGYLSQEDLLGTTTYSLANGEVAEGTVILLRNVEIGGMKLTGVRASIIHNLNAPLLLGQSALALLGKVLIDYNSNTLTIHPGTDNGNQVTTATNRPKFAESTVVNSSSLYGNAFSVSGWEMASKPNVNDDSDETGKIVFQIQVDQNGEIVNVRQLQSTVSPSVGELYRRAVRQIRLRPKGGTITPTSATGTITFIIKSRK